MLEKLFPENWSAFFHADNGRLALAIVAIVVFGTLSLKILLLLIGSLGKKGLSEKVVMLAKKAVFYAGLVVLVLLVLNQLGIDLTAVLGAAGIAGIALGFAAQTSISNIISGIFLLSENAFSPGDVIKVGSVTGTILSIDLLSIKVRTFDNQFVRLPNEMLIKAELTNVTRFPLRRLDLRFTVGYDTDLAKLKDILLPIVGRVPQCLEEPEPFFQIQDYGSLGVSVLFGVWFARDDYLAVNNGLKTRLLPALKKEGITLPTAVAVSES